jgi:hypothetical protein
MIDMADATTKPRNVLTVEQTIKAADWVKHATLTEYDSLVHFAGVASKVAGFTITEANARRLLDATGRPEAFKGGRERRAAELAAADQVRKCAPRLLAALKDCIRIADRETMEFIEARAAVAEAEAS